MQKFALAAAVLMLAACGGSPQTDTPNFEVSANAVKVPVTSDSTTNEIIANSGEFSVYPLRQAAEVANFHLGAATGRSLFEDEELVRALSGNFTILTSESGMKFKAIRPEQDVYNFERGDALADFARAHGMKMRGHVLVWHEGLPDWVKNGTFTREELIEVMRDHIHTVLGYYRDNYSDVFVEWDVVNEAFVGDGSRRQSIWQTVIGDDWVELAFQFAEEAWPDLTLYYLDFYENNFVTLDAAFRPDGSFEPEPQGTGPGATSGNSLCTIATVPKCGAMRAMVEDFVDRGIPIDGTGFQAHIASSQSPDYAQLTDWIGDLGLEWGVMELDMPCTTDSAANDPCFTNQASAFGNVVRACLDDAACNTVVQWGVGDRYTFWTGTPSGQFVNPLMLDTDFHYKPAAFSILSELQAATN